MSAIEERAAVQSQRDDLEELLAAQRRSFVADGPPDVALRRNRIDRLLAMVLDNSEGFVAATAADYGSRSRSAAFLSEILGMLSVVEHTRAHVPQWMRATKLLRATRFAGLRAEVLPSPLGVVGVIGPWNFPIQLTVLPAAAAFAAGNRVMIKMSEVTPRTAELMATTVPKYFDATELQVVTGGPEVAAAFAGLPFDHLFFTGSPSIGKLVARAASDNLVPVTLELGGKNPVVVAPGADLERAASRIAQARMVNGGQVCVCPDYVFVPDAQVDRFVEVARRTLSNLFPSIVGNPDYCSSVNQANFDRVVGLIADARAQGARIDSVVPAGEVLPDPGSRKIAPTIVRDVDDRMRIASEEVFGPVLVVRGYSALDEAVRHINTNPSPLVAYWFGPDDADFRHFVSHTRSGGVARNDFAAHMIPSDAPFGGVGHSGTGAYHGKAGFDTFSHYRSVVGNDLPFSVTGQAAKPFSTSMRVSTDLMLRRARSRTAARLKKFR
ncbi:aldehyde dehydrogenase [Mycolicibacterium peregrinum]|uniref:aldehyde dehydrogenase family protein n=1 Tax=Mycolicibacterium peregrinum TaxID=43304 RepID=UPI0007EA8259|nr:aldehyde dehydrogenase family protein [Mycolicibacterium peregrinum]OBF43851.1 aldehyde dehydrogenase [Mycolicibacterium peregrinum]